MGTAALGIIGAKPRRAGLEVSAERSLIVALRGVCRLPVREGAVQRSTGMPWDYELVQGAVRAVFRRNARKPTSTPQRPP